MIFAVQPGIVDGDCQLVRHRLDCGDVVIVESRFLGALNGERANHLIPADQRQRHLGARRLARFQVARVGAHIGDDQRLAQDMTHLVSRGAQFF